MSYALKEGHSIETEAQRIVANQLARAVACLHSAEGAGGEEVIDEARRHVTKARAMIGLVRPAGGRAVAAANRRLRIASHMLEPIARGEAVLGTVGRLNGATRERLPLRTLGSIRRSLAARVASIERKARRDRVLPRTAAVLSGVRTRPQDWTLRGHGFTTIAPGLERSVRRARKAVRRVTELPTTDHFHSLRRRVGELWFQVCLVEERCGGDLIADEHRLESLDGCLGEYDNVVTLERLLVTEAVLSRRETLRCVRLLRRYQRQLRQRAFKLAARVLRDKPRRVVRRVERLWRTERERARAAETRAACRASA